MSKHHNLDPYPMPKDKEPLFVNEPWITDKSLLDFDIDTKPENAEDNIRVYIPLDLSFESILRRLDRIISFYGEANEDNELEFSMDVDGLVSQIEIYDQIWSVRHMPCFLQALFAESCKIKM